MYDVLMFYDSPSTKLRKRVEKVPLTLRRKASDWSKLSDMENRDI